jgi:hypothetical protein
MERAARRPQAKATALPPLLDNAWFVRVWSLVDILDLHPRCSTVSISRGIASSP